MTRLAWEKQRTQLLVRFGYDGSRFHGLQPQRDVPTAGEALCERFVDAGVWPKALCYAARTDAGVHATRNLATCWLKGRLDVEAVIFAVQRDRDDGLRTVVLEQVPINVHARGISRGKHYRYVIEDGCQPLAPNGPSCWRVHPQLDAGAMQAGAAHLVGEHDFSALRAKRCQAGTTRKVMHEVAVQREGSQVVIDVVGDAFLRQMVRIMIGTLAMVGAGWWPPAQVSAILKGGERRAAGPTAPACGLTLVEVLTEQYG